jgi:hypothetical protein
MVVVSDQSVGCYRSYPQFLKVRLNLRRQFHHLIFDAPEF